MSDWRSVASWGVYAIPGRQISQRGGLDGVGDQATLASALARPQNLAASSEPDAADLAAAYAFGLSRTHRFADGNTRVAWVVARVFLVDNGQSLNFDKVEAVRTAEAHAAGQIGEADLAA